MSDQRLALHHKFYSAETLVSAFLTTLPGGGFFLRTDEPYDLWTRLELTFELVPGLEPITCLAEVIWVNRGGPPLVSGMGLRFVEIAPQDKARLDAFLRERSVQDEIFEGRYSRYLIFSDHPAEPTTSEG